MVVAIVLLILQHFLGLALDSRAFLRERLCKRKRFKTAPALVLVMRVSPIGRVSQKRNQLYVGKYPGDSGWDMWMEEIVRACLACKIGPMPHALGCCAQAEWEERSIPACALFKADVEEVNLFGKRGHDT